MENIDDFTEILMGAKSETALLRDKKIIRVSITGIIANFFLAAFKIFVGLFSNSIAIILDALNNISDAASSVITIVGTKLAEKSPDKKHPFGHGRIEYFTAMFISILVLYAGITSFIESVKKIIHPVTPSYNYVSLIIVSVAIVVKILLGYYVKTQGKKLNSDSLVNSGVDAIMDSFISSSTLIAAIIFMIFGLSLEAILGVIISCVIIHSGIQMLKETLSKLLGENLDPETGKKIKETIGSFKEVRGVYDLVLNNYGPDTYNGSAHIEVADTMTASQIDELIRKIQFKVLREHNIIMTAIGIYSYNTHGDDFSKMRNDIYETALSFKEILQIHGFYVKEEEKIIRFDIVVTYDTPDRQKIFIDCINAVKEKYPDYKILAALDSEY
jgi:cation diffusion facilitator family transporter